MNPELDKKLCEKYPQIFANRHADMRTTAMCLGFDCGDGWYTIIDVLCMHLQARRDGYLAWPEGAREIYQPVAAQVKEKYGGLRFYYDGGDDFSDGVVAMAEAMSYRTCEKCGNPGVLREGGWLKTLCDEHAEGREALEDTQKR